MLGDGGVQRREPCRADPVERLRPGRFGGADHQVDVACPCLLEFLEELGIGLDVDPAPAVLVEKARHGQVAGLGGPDIDVEAVRDMLQRPPQHHIFLILCPG